MNQTALWSRVQVIARRPSAQYEGVVYDQDITVREPSGQELTLFDMAPMLGGEMPEGAAVDVVVGIAAPLNLRAATEPGGLEAEVIALEPRPEVSPPAASRPELTSRRWILLQGLGGPMLLAESELAALGGDVAVGTLLTWDDARLDLLAWKPAGG